VFPDEYHLVTLETLLNACTNQLEAKVDVKRIFISLMDRLADFALNSDNSVSQLNNATDIYQLFKNNIDNLIESTRPTEFKNVLELMVAVLSFNISGRLP
jgi:vacuolar protein sorting-associated protein 35